MEERKDDAGVSRSAVRHESPGRTAVPYAKTTAASSLQLSASVRHEVKQEVVEPKVYSPHKTRRGQVPRRIEVERKKREYSLFDINAELEANGVLSYLKAAHLSNTRDVKETLDRLSLSVFDDVEFDPQSVELWRHLIDESMLTGGLPARGMFIRRYIPMIT